MNIRDVSKPKEALESHQASPEVDNLAKYCIGITIAVLAGAFLVIFVVVVLSSYCQCGKDEDQAEDEVIIRNIEAYLWPTIPAHTNDNKNEIEKYKGELKEYTS